MFDFFYEIPDKWLFIVLNVCTISLSLFVVYMIDKKIPIDWRYKENQAIGYVSSTICLIFAVLAGFAALYVLTNYNNAVKAVQHEADVAMALYDDAEWADMTLQAEIRETVKRYYREIIDVEWPTLARGQRTSPKTDIFINEMFKNLHEYYRKPGPSFGAQEISKKLNALRNAHAERTRYRTAALDPDIWLVILCSGFLTIVINYAFGMQFYLHLIAVAAVTLVVTSMIFLLIVLDHPFEGLFSVSSRPYAYYLNLIESS